MDKHRVLLNGRLLPGVEARLAADYDLHMLAGERDPRAFLAAHGAGFVALVTSAGAGADAALIDALPELRVISNFGVGAGRGHERHELGAVRGQEGARVALAGQQVQVVVGRQPGLDARQQAAVQQYAVLVHGRVLSRS